jgi:hypothetical protein
MKRDNILKHFNNTSSIRVFMKHVQVLFVVHVQRGRYSGIVCLQMESTWCYHLESFISVMLDLKMVISLTNVEQNIASLERQD